MISNTLFEIFGLEIELCTINSIEVCTDIDTGWVGYGRECIITDRRICYLVENEIKMMKGGQQ